MALPRRISSKNVMHFNSLQQNQPNKVFELIDNIEKQGFFKNIQKNEDGQLIDQSETLNKSERFSRKRYSNDD